MSDFVLTRIEAMQQDLEQLRKAIEYRDASSKRRTRLRGLWKGVSVSDEDFREARRSVFGDGTDLDE